MFGFLIKKAFFNYWDNFYRICILNLGYVLVCSLALGVGYFIGYLLPLPSIVKEITVVFFIITIINIFHGALYGFTREIADDKQPGFADFFRHLKASLLTSLLFSVLFSAFVFLFFFSFSFWGNMNNFFGEVAKVFLLCAAIIIVISSQYFYPIYVGLDKKFFKAIKKMFLIFIDNPMFSFGMFISSLIIPVISAVTLFMIPGLSMVSLFQNVGLKLRLYKYDYFEEHPDADPKKIPWETLLHADDEKVGKRSLKGMIFPWKE
jgi:hypothetical protein